MTNRSQPAKPEPEFLTVKEVARHLQCSVKTVRRRIRDKRLRAKRDGGLIRVSVGDFYAYCTKLRPAVEPSF